MLISVARDADWSLILQSVPDYKDHQLSQKSSYIPYHLHICNDHYGQSFQIVQVLVDLMRFPNQKYLPACLIKIL
jgi:hypothetical protein